MKLKFETVVFIIYGYSRGTVNYFCSRIIENFNYLLMCSTVKFSSKIEILFIFWSELKKTLLKFSEKSPSNFFSTCFSRGDSHFWTFPANWQKFPTNFQKYSTNCFQPLVWKSDRPLGFSLSISNIWLSIILLRSF